MVGEIDGRHMSIETPAKSGTLYHNYKGTFSIFILAISDAKYNSTLGKVGQYVSNNNSGELGQSKIRSTFKNTFKVLPGTNLDIPYFLVGDEFFLLIPWPLCPYPGRLLQLLELIYNYSHSRDRRVIKNAF